MTIARKQLVCLESTPYYHCISRCVRRAFLCGIDRYTEQSYEHRREWVESLILLLSQAFCIDVAAYAVMSNHYHVVLHINQSGLDGLDDFEVIDRWGKLYSLPEIVRQYRSGVSLDSGPLALVSSHLERYRANLANISKFMGYLNERIARQANTEDQCTGRFWEGRFKSQALLDETALIQCMAYVDLNPIRATIAKTPEQSDYTSIKRRITVIQLNAEKNKNPITFHDLLPFQDESVNTDHTYLPFNLLDYIDIVDGSGRCLVEGKTGRIGSDMLPILTRLNLNPKQWMLDISGKTTAHPNHRLSWMPKALGTKESIKAYCQMIGKQWIWSEIKIRPT